MPKKPRRQNTKPKRARRRASPKAPASRGLAKRLAEALAQQTATSEILRVIRSSPADIQPVFDTIAESAARLCESLDTVIFRRDGDRLVLVAHRGAILVGAVGEFSLPVIPGTGPGRAVLEGRSVHVADMQAEADEFPESSANAHRMGFRTLLSVPLMRDGVAIGAINLRRAEARPFSDRQVALLQTFADQAVIAIENVRLFTELQEKNQALTRAHAQVSEALEQQTATGEILRVISSSPTDVQPVFDAIVASATRLCEADLSGLYRFDGTLLHFSAQHGRTPEEIEAARRAFPQPLGRASVSARAILDARVVQVPDARDDPDMAGPLRSLFRTVMAIPMLRDGRPIGTITVARRIVRPFSDEQIALLRTFADQAVIAIENVRLFTELQEKNAAITRAHAQVTEALEQQTATGEILRVISSSPTDVQPVFDTIVRSAARLLDAETAFLFRFDGQLLHHVAQHGLTPEGQDVMRRAWPMALSRGTGVGRSILDRRIAHIPDVKADPDYTLAGVADTARFRAVLAVPMLRDGVPIGTLAVNRVRSGPFSDREIALLQTFADQAMIAIENVRLFRELEARNSALTESLDQQTATGEILRVISSSPTDVQPVFDTIVQSAVRLCDGIFSALFRFDGELIHQVAQHNFTPEAMEEVRRVYPRRPTRAHGSGRAILERSVVHIPDVEADPEYEHHQLTRAVGLRSGLYVPMMREGEPIGVVMVARAEPGPFSTSQIELLKTFAEQAVIAIENVRLFRELEARNGALTEALEQQTATSEILRAISSSPTDVQPVFDTIVRSAVTLCGGMFGNVQRFDGEFMHLAAHSGHGEEWLSAMRRVYPRRPDRTQLASRAVLTGSVVHVPDVLDDPEYDRGIARAGGFRALVSVPMLRAGTPIGVITVASPDAKPFPDGQIALLQTFADQAVIAIENVRLFKELEARNRDLSETLEQQTATSEVLKVISRSTFDLEPVLQTLIENATRLCGAEAGAIYRLDGELQRLAAACNVAPEHRAYVEQHPIAPGRGTAVGRAVLEGRTVHIHDVLADEGYTYSGVRLFGYRTILGVPMLREGLPVGVFAVWRSEVLPFTDKQIELVTTFADQGAIAIENVRLLVELQARTGELTRSVGELRALGEVSQAVSSTLDLETVLATIVSRAVQLSGSASGTVYEFDEATQSFRVTATHQVSPELLEAIRAAPIRLGQGAIGRAGVTRAPVQIPDIEGERQLVAAQTQSLLIREGMRSLLAVPLIREDRLLGGLVIARREQGKVSPEVIALLQTFATQSVLAMHNAGLFREIQRQKQYSEALVETSPVAIVTIDLRGTVTGWNPGAERLYGYTQVEALGRPMEDLVATPELREEVRANVRDTLAGEWIRTIARRARKDGTLVDVEISSMPVVVDGARVGMIGIYHDITELLQARREAETANEAKSAFLATMSHEIRTPMNAVIGMSGLLLNTALTDEQREYAEVIRQSGDALLTVINDILDFSKIEAGKLELESQPFDLRECVEGALDLVATRAAEKGLDLAYLIGDDTPAGVVGDVTRLRQVLLNLLSNAVKFTERGEVVVSVSAHRLPGAAALHELTFAVRDTGIGIPADRLSRLFQSFTQVDASTTRRYGGTGLGLAISRRLTELMGGQIVVTSQAGAGSEFSFTLRARAAEVPVTARRDLSGVQPSLSGKRVLVVDDNATNRRILTAHLDAWGMTSRASALPAEALGWIRGGEAFDIGILDMHMPEMDGVDLAQAIRAHLGDATPPLILFTSLGRREARAESVGFAAYLNKPIKPSQLFDAVVSVLPDQPIHVPKRGIARSEFDPDMARRHPLRILLAEDNVVNQKLALRLLAQMGYRADLAANGLEAIDAVERQTYDVVLMDVQMPELDGLEASREINRRWPGARPRLVAMTANAMEGDREACMAAGMDDYVAKPIRVEELIAALERSGGGALDGGGGAPAASAGGSTSFDRSAVERLTATMGGPFVAELIDTFVQDGRELTATLWRSLRAVDLDAFRRAAHSLKSNGETLGAGELATLARELEGMARGGSLEGAAERLEPLAREYERVARALGEVRRGLPG